MNDLQKLGSSTARNGFKNEREIVEKFNSWKTDLDAQECLIEMGHDINTIENVFANQISGYKTDVQVKIELTIVTDDAIVIENISIKLISNSKGFNQIDKRYVEKYVKMWNIPEEIADSLRLYTGEFQPYKAGCRDHRRMYFDEISKVDVQAVIDFFENNRIMIVADILRGSNVPAMWMLVVDKMNGRWVIKEMNSVMNHYGRGEIYITDRGNLRFGRITVQRKGGDAGRDTAKMLQFKIDPGELFDL